MISKATSRGSRASGEGGFALILAILALMLLTFLGLTLATTTSTELQIATNYRWGRQALYNAQAGLEAAKVILSNPPVADGTLGITALPVARTAPWALPGDPGLPIVGRDHENHDCDKRGFGMGYGLVLNDTVTRYENVSTWAGKTLSGSFTIWIRRALIPTNGTFLDSTDNNTAVVTIEGTAPYTFVDANNDGINDNAPPGGGNQSTRIIETVLNLNKGSGVTSCSGLEGQTGMAPSGDNFGCALLDETSINVLKH